MKGKGAYLCSEPIHNRPRQEREPTPVAYSYIPANGRRGGLPGCPINLALKIREPNSTTLTPSQRSGTGEGRKLTDPSH